MKIKSILFAGLAALALSACSDDNVGNTNPNDLVEGYLALNISSPQTRTSVGNDGTDEGLPAESKIDNITIVFTDNSGQIQHIKNPSITAGKTEKFKIALGQYLVYALVNNPVAVVVGENIERVIEVNVADEIEKGYKSGSFFMVNEHSSETNVAGVNVSVTSSNTEIAPATATVKVDRVAVKIQDETNYTTNAPQLTSFPSFISSVEVQGFSVLNINKEFNLVQTWNNTNTNGTSLSASVLSTPLAPAGTLVADQYFKNIGEYTFIGKTGDKITSIVDLTKDDASIYGFGAAYTTENRPTILFYGSGNLTAGRGETTGVIYRVKANAGTFYTFGGKSYEQLSDIQNLPEFSSTTLPTDASLLRALNIKVYEDGVMYYTYYILDPNIAHRYEGKDYYGVFRNSIYNLKVSKLSKLGDDVPGGGVVDPTSPEEPGNPPIDADEAYIEVTVNVNPWVLNEIEIEF